MGLLILQEFRDKLDNIMLKAMHKSVLLYGYESYTGRFIKWYAEDYHNIKIDYLVSTDMSRSRAYDMEIFRPSILDFDYRDVRNAIIWVVEPMTDTLREALNKKGYVLNVDYFDLYSEIYGDDVYGINETGVDVFHLRKEGRRDIQFLEWLEWKYDCNFLTRIKHDDLEVAKEHGEGYGCTTQKEIFTILDRCHCIPKNKDAIFDYGCGKGGALLSFLDYGFERVGGVEYEPKIYEVLEQNVRKLGISESQIELIQGDAAKVDAELDEYNWFYFYRPFDGYIFEKCIERMCRSYKRKKRKMHIIVISPFSHKQIEESKAFRLTNQFTIDLRQRVVHLYETFN